ncbi:Dolichyl-phosphate-mannose-protein mannosyltransferase-domain-containing protein, partial [Coemansia mojavensis]
LRMDAKSKLPVYKACLATTVPQRQQALVCFLPTIAAAVARLWHIETPNRVTWDESHFGRMGAMYLNHTFIRDAHPPLGKLMIALAQHWAGRNGTFTFPSGSLFRFRRMARWTHSAWWILMRW